MPTLNLTDQDVVRLKIIEMDRDAEDALAFICERIIPELQRVEKMKLKSHLDGGKGSMF